MFAVWLSSLSVCIQVKKSENPNSVETSEITKNAAGVDPPSTDHTCEIFVGVKVYLGD